jgi:hypothetical protein
MKKIIALSACVILLTSGLANAAALATGAKTPTDGLSVYGDITAAAAAAGTSTLIGKLSKGVYLGAAYTSATYALTTKHNSGTTQYGTASDATAIYKQEVGTTALTAPGAATYSAFDTGWTAM